MRPEPLAPLAAVMDPAPAMIGGAPAQKEQPMAAAARIQFPNGLNYCGTVVLMVPAQKRLLIEALSFEGESLGGQGFVKVTTTTSGQTMAYIIPALNLKLAGAADSVIGSASIQLYVDPGSAVVATYYRGAGAPPEGVTSIRVSLLGHYVEMQQSFA